MPVFTFSFTFLELGKFHKTKDELSSIVEKWAYFFKHAEETSEKDLERIIGNDSIIERAYDELNRFGWNEDEMLGYEQVIKKERDYDASMHQKFDEGCDKGRQEEKREIARNLLRQGLSKDIVSTATALSLADIEEL